MSTEEKETVRGINTKYGVTKWKNIMDVTQSNYANMIKRLERRYKVSNYILIYYSIFLIIMTLTTHYFPGYFHAKLGEYFGVILSIVVLAYSLINNSANYPVRIADVERALNKIKTIKRELNEESIECCKEKYYAVTDATERRDDMDFFITVVNLCKARGYIYPGSEIYGGLSNTWDYGPLGVELKNNVKALWRKKFIQESKYNVGLDAAILMNPLVWVASGHVGGFSDPLIDCKECKTRHRADKLIEEWAHEQGKDMIADGMTDEEMIKFLDDNNICCPNCGKHNFTSIRKFNLMFKTFQGVTEDAKAEIYLRPETAQGIFVNFKNVMRTTRRKLPMGIAQIGKAFRNEITPGNFTFRTREFEQMELEFFCKPGTDLKWHEYWKKFCENWLISLGMKEENIRLRDHSPEELVFYSKATTDIEYAFPFGWGELWGIADRTDYDLSNHARQSNQDFTYLDPETNEKYIPYCIEPSLGADRVALAFLCNAYDEEEITEGDTRVVLHLHPALAPYKVAVLPLSKKLSDKAQEVYEQLSKKFMCEYDEAGSIGKRYRREDEIGTPYCVTVDFDTLNDNSVTIRDRDTMEQVRVNIDELENWISEKVEF